MFVVRARCGKHCRLWNMCLLYLLACQVRVIYRPLRSLLLCLCGVFRTLMNSLVRWFWNMRFCVSLQWIWRYLWFSKLCFDLVFAKYKRSLTPPDRTSLSQLFLMGRKQMKYGCWCSMLADDKPLKSSYGLTFSCVIYTSVPARPGVERSNWYVLLYYLHK